MDKLAQGVRAQGSEKISKYECGAQWAIKTWAEQGEHLCGAQSVWSKISYIQGNGSASRLRIWGAKWLTVGDGGWNYRKRGKKNRINLVPLHWNWCKHLFSIYIERCANIDINVCINVYIHRYPYICVLLFQSVQLAKYHRLHWLINKRNLFLQLQSPEDQNQDASTADQALVRTFFQVADCWLLPVSSHNRQHREAASSVMTTIRALFPFRKALPSWPHQTLITSKNSTPNIITLRLQHINFRGK